ncbi:MAG: lipid-A-disaccharide synthase [Oligoflexia bacterium]|nr:lipid-A-disaccharide synthase [Oligoflexia bacterium]
MRQRILISAGELSGDEHAAKLVRAYRAIEPSSHFFGMGGSRLREVGVETIVDSEKSASVMGFFPVLQAFSQIRASFNKLKLVLQNERPDALVLVDYPDFNLRLARYAKAIGIKTFYFIPPKLWAWRSGRVKDFIRSVDCAACIFPFEVDFFLRHGYQRAKFVGHPFEEEIVARPSSALERTQFCTEIGIAPSQQIVAILPGSRMQEIKRLLPIACATATRISTQTSNLSCVMAIAPSLNAQQIKALIPYDCPLKVSTRSALEVMRFAKVGLLKSGTSNLQAAFLGLPFIMFYQASATTAFIVKRLVQIREYSPVNIVRPGSVPEIVQEGLTPQRLAQELTELLNDPSKMDKQRTALAEVVQRLRLSESSEFSAASGAYCRTADLLKKTIG